MFEHLIVQAAYSAYSANPSISARVLDGIVLLISGITGTSTQIADTATVIAKALKVTAQYTGPDGEPSKIVDNVSAYFFRQYADLQAGNIQATEVYVPTGRYHLAGTERIDVTLNWGSVDGADITAAGGDVTAAQIIVYSDYDATIQNESLHFKYAARTHDGGTDNYPAYVENVRQMLYVGDTAPTSVSYTLEGTTYEVTAALADMMTRMKFRHEGESGAGLYVVYNVPLAKAFAAVPYFSVNADEGELVQIGAEPNAQAVARAVNENASARKALAEKIAARNGANAAVLQTLGIL